MCQTILQGIDAIHPLIKDHKFLLVRDEAYDYLDIKTIFDKHPHIEFSEFTPNPLYEQVCKGVDIFVQEQCQMIVAVGGGSAIDVAKCIKLFCKMNKECNYLEQEREENGVVLIAVPTTAGTGSESTRHAVVYYKGEKQSISHESIVPDYAILDASVLKTLPVYQKKCTMLDALCQAIESWWSVHSTPESIGYSKKAVELIKENWDFYINENTYESGKNILLAANYAGRAINITATTAAHAMSYKITSLYNVPHGHAVAMCMLEVWPYMLQHTYDCIDARGSAYFQKVLVEIDRYMDFDCYTTLYEKLDMGHPISVRKVTDVELLAKSVNPVRLKNNPVNLDYDVIKDMYERIIKE